MNLRAFGKISFLLVIIGFFMPIACDLNGFQLAEIFFEDDVIFGILMYLIFISAIIGLTLGFLLIFNNKVNRGFEWTCLLLCITSGISIYIFMLQGGPELQSGAYLILTGWIFAFIFQVISDSSSKNSQNLSSSNKKCRQCQTIYKGFHSSCPKCNFFLYEETDQSIDTTALQTDSINTNNNLIISGKGKGNSGIITWCIAYLILALIGVFMCVMSKEELILSKEIFRFELFLGITFAGVWFVLGVLAFLTFIIYAVLLPITIIKNEINVYGNKIEGKGYNKYFIYGDIRVQAFQITHEKIVNIDTNKNSITIHTPDNKYKCYTMNAAEIKQAILDSIK